MKDKELEDALQGLCAYDMGELGRGIHDEGLRSKVIVELKERAKDEISFRLWISKFIRDAYLSDDSLMLGYGLDDVVELVRWLSHYMEFDL